MPCSPTSQSYADHLFRQRQSLRERYDALADKPAEVAASQIAELRQQIAHINAELKSLEAQPYSSAADHCRNKHDVGLDHRRTRRLQRRTAITALGDKRSEQKRDENYQYATHDLLENSIPETMGGSEGTGGVTLARSS